MLYPEIRGSSRASDTVARIAARHVQLVYSERVPRLLWLCVIALTASAVLGLLVSP